MQKELDCVSIGFSGCHVKRSDAAKRSCVHIGAFADQVLDHFLVAGARKDYCTNDELAPYDIAKQRGNSTEVQNLLKYDHCR